MSRGATAKGRARTARLSFPLPAARPLLRTTDFGAAVRVDGRVVGATGDRWIEPFLAANDAALRRVGVRAEVGSADGTHLRLVPGARIGAVPLLAPSTRRVAAGLVVEPRFRWSALGAVFTATGFRTEPELGGTELVPGSAREVPPWLLAAPVLRRLEALLTHRRRGFTERHEHRPSPRGRVDWGAWAARDVPAGRWASLPCTFSDPDDDPTLMSAVRWTLARLAEELETLRDAAPARALGERVRLLQVDVGQGPSRRPDARLVGRGSAWIAEAVQAMGWVAEERGLGGARSLDGLSWHLPVDALWEAWVSRFTQSLGAALGLPPQGQGTRRHRLNWHGGITSMGSVAPDCALLTSDRAVWIDAKYKAHLSLLARRGWQGVGESVREAHRADLHQALAYASLADTERVDSVLVYPTPPERAEDSPVAIATVASGRRRVRLILAGLPFGFVSPTAQARTLDGWRGWLNPG